MILKQQGGLSWLEFELFSECKKLKHAVFLREGGLSQGEYSGLNLSLGVGDEKQTVDQNRALIKDQFKAASFHWMEQCHGKTVCMAEQSPPVADGLLTQSPGQMLLVCHADCQAALFYDPIRHVLAGVHAGWRGQVQGIYREAIHRMKELFSSKKEDILVAISPSLGPQSAEFKHWKEEFPERFWDKREGNYFNLWQIAQMELLECGILPHHLQIAEIDTVTNPSFYSYRRDKVTGRSGTCGMLI